MRYRAIGSDGRTMSDVESASPDAVVIGAEVDPRNRRERRLRPLPRLRLVVVDARTGEPLPAVKVSV